MIVFVSWPSTPVRRITSLLALGASAALLTAGVATAHAAEYAYGALQSGELAQYSLGSGGVLTPLSPAEVPAGGQELSVVITPDGRHLYAGDNAGRAIDEFAINPGGTLTSVGTQLLPSGAAPDSLAVSPDGASLYVADASPSNHQIDEFTIAANGTLSAKSPLSIDLPFATDPESLAVSPDGSGLFVAAKSFAGALLRYPIGVGGVLGSSYSGELATDPGGAPTAPSAVVVSPNGQNVYVTGAEQSSSDDSVVSQFSVGAGGAFAAMTPLTVSTSSQAFAWGLAIDPDGQQLYVGSRTASSTVLGGTFVFEIGAGGQLTLDPAPPLLFGASLNALAFSPDGSSLYAADVACGLYSLSAGQGGNLAPKTPFAAAIGPAYQIAVTPDQAPVAAFSATSGAPGAPTLLNASASAASDGVPATYAWSFGDGTTAVTPGPVILHTFAAAGSYPITLTVTDDAGCSTAVVFTGETAYCNGGPSARTTQTVAVAAASGGAPSAAAPPTISAASVTHPRFRVARAATAVSASAAVPVGTAFRVTLSAPARLSIVIEHLARGLRSGGRCVAPTAALRRRHDAHCTRTLPSGTLTRASESAGADSVAFTGRIGRRALPGGRYTALLRATDAAGTSRSVQVAFTVVG